MDALCIARNRKKAVLASEDLQFLHEKVAAIDESATKYHKPARGKKRSAAASAAAKSGASKKKVRTTAAKARPADERRIQDLATALPKDQDGDTSAGRKAAASLDVEEDEDYDESDSE
ncbi:hypothetical protein BBJ28_00008952 [Nothophytophthora sp. Chile5]|nr:hypothetical protein BBJ28_00008952 [Nothophytophthora sp. Chile5]